MSSVCKDISELTKDAQQACRAFLTLCQSRGLAVRITETYRSQMRQDELYRQGRTAPGKVVTWTKNSRHTSRRAWDICQNIKGREYSDRNFFEECAKVARALGITWGGDWNTPDMPHFEVAANWSMPKNMRKELEDEMTSEEKMEFETLKKRVAELEEKRKVYHYTKDVPDWGRSTVQKLLDKGVFKGAAADDLNLSEDMLRMMVISDKAGVYK